MISNFIDYLAARIFFLFQEYSLAGSASYNPEKIKIITTTIGFNCCLLLFFSAVLLSVYRRKKIWFNQFLLLITFLELFLFSRGNLITLPAGELTVENPTARWLKNNLGNYRFLATNGNFAYTGLGVYWTHLRAREPFSPNGLTAQELVTFSQFKKILKAMPENSGLSYELADVAGYAATVLKNYAYFHSPDPRQINTIQITDLADPKLDVLGVKYLVTGYPADEVKPLNLDKFLPVWQNAEIKIYENQTVWPRIFITRTEGGIEAVTPEVYSPEKVIIEYDFPRASTLVLTDNYYPGWQVLIDGKKQPLKKYLKVFRAVSVAPGEHRISFIYQPQSLRWGAVISLATLLIMLSLSLWKKRKQLRLFS